MCPNKIENIKRQIVIKSKPPTKWLISIHLTKRFSAQSFSMISIIACIHVEYLCCSSYVCKIIIVFPFPKKKKKIKADHWICCPFPNLNSFWIIFFMNFVFRVERSIIDNNFSYLRIYSVVLLLFRYAAIRISIFFLYMHRCTPVYSSDFGQKSERSGIVYIRMTWKSDFQSHTN